jgi:hypothetical protein
MQILADAGIVPSASATYTLAQVQAPLTAFHGFVPTVSCAGSTLDEIWYHYNVRGNVQTGEFVPAAPGTPPPFQTLLIFISYTLTRRQMEASQPALPQASAISQNTQLALAPAAHQRQPAPPYLSPARASSKRSPAGLTMAA